MSFRTRFLLPLAGASLLVAALEAQQPGQVSDELTDGGLRSDAPLSPIAPPATGNPSLPVSPATAAGSMSAQLQPVLAVLTNVLDQHRRSGNREAEAATLCAIGNSYNALGQQQRAVETFQLALTIYRETANKKGEANALSHIGDVYRGWGFPEQAIHFYRDALQLYGSVGNSQEKAIALNNLGVAYLSLRNKKKSLEYLNQALDAYRAMDDRRAEALALNNIGMAYNSVFNDPQRAFDYFQQAMTKLQLINDRGNQAIVLDNEGAACVKLGKKDMAAISFDRALVLFRETGDARGEARVVKHLNALGEPGPLASAQAGPGAN